VNQVVYVSATPSEYEVKKADGQVVEQIVRPTGLLDPDVQVKPVEGQVEDLLAEIQATTEKGCRVLVTTLTKKLAERLTEYYAEAGVKVRYLHSDIDTLERMEIIRALRLGEFDVLVGINLLREGLDLPEVALVAVLDADKEGFLRNETSLIQTIGRAARNEEGRVILYADRMTRSMERAMEETKRRRALQAAYNKEHGITPKSVVKSVRDLLEVTKSIEEKKLAIPDNIEQKMQILEEQMKRAAMELEFEAAAKLRDELFRLRDMLHKGSKK